MIFDPLTPLQGPRSGDKNYFAVARHIHVSKSHTKNLVGFRLMVKEEITIWTDGRSETF